MTSPLFILAIDSCFVAFAPLVGMDKFLYIREFQILSKKDAVVWKTSSVTEVLLVSLDSSRKLGLIPTN